jgi:hypothetical protein
MCPYFSWCPIAFFRPPYLMHFYQCSAANRNMYRRKKKKDNHALSEVTALINCFNPAVLNSRELFCLTSIDFREIVKNMIDSMLPDDCIYNCWNKW